MLFLYRFYFDFSTTYIGAGMICPHIVNFSLLLGAILSWGILWPFIESKAGDWYAEGLGSSDFTGLSGYKVIITISTYKKNAHIIRLKKIRANFRY